MLTRFIALLALLASWAVPLPARAEVSEVTFAQQFGIAFLPIMVMENQKLVEKEAAARGLPDVKGAYLKMSGPSVMVDAILAGSLHFAAQGPPTLALLWDRTKGAVKGAGGVTTYNLWLNTRNPNVKTAKDFSDKDRIAVPSVKVSTQAIMLQMLAEREFGADQKFHFDPWTVGLGHPDAMASVLNPTVVASRVLQLDPPYTQGPVLADNAVIPLERTRVPVEWDDIRQQLDKLVKQLGPEGGSGKPGDKGALGNIVDSLADTMNGRLH